LLALFRTELPELTPFGVELLALEPFTLELFMPERLAFTDARLRAAYSS